MSLLLLMGGSSGSLIIPLATDPILVLIGPDEVATGLPIRIWAEHTDNTEATALTDVPQFRIFRLDNDGLRTPEIPLSYMTALGEGYYYDWTPSVSGSFLMTVAAHHEGNHLFGVADITARPKFDPVALALHDTLVARN
jgi:hypothetical protein